MEEMDLSDPSFQSLIDHLITLCLSAVDIVAAVVNSDSPEGHLPASTTQVISDPCDSDAKSESVMNGENDRTSQLVLLCSWRTAKDACLLLGDICTRCANLPEERDMGQGRRRLARHSINAPARKTSP